MLSGIPASPGFACGTAYCLPEEIVAVAQYMISEEQCAQEIASFTKARQQSIAQLTVIQQQAEATLGAHAAAIFKAHALLLADEEFSAEIIATIQQQRLLAVAAIHTVIEQHRIGLRQLTNSYLKERAADLHDVEQRLIGNIQHLSAIDLLLLQTPTIVIAKNVAPSTIMQLDGRFIRGLITQQSNKNSHMAIIARALGLPAIVGVRDLLQQVHTGDAVVVDACNNQIHINPETALQQHLVQRQHREQDAQERALHLKALPATTLDGHTVTIGANIGHPRDVQAALAQGAEGIGLYRTEFLYMEGARLPHEEEQLTVYKTVALQMHPKPVVIRTVDIGSDKTPRYLAFPQEENPSLGCRGIRFCLQQPALLETQLRAILRAALFGSLQILFPMVTTLEEIRQLKQIVVGVKSGLSAECIPYASNIPIGIMIETPAAAVTSAQLAKEVDFFSIGTNDLAQYLLAVDRGNAQIAHLYPSLSPALLAVVGQVREAAHRAGKRVGLCGELASDKRAALLLLGLGVDQLSMGPAALLRIKNLVRQVHFTALQTLAQQALLQTTAQEIVQLVDAFFTTHQLVL